VFDTALQSWAVNSPSEARMEAVPTGGSRGWKRFLVVGAADGSDAL